MGLEIRKISAKVWKHINDVDGEFILSKFYVKEEFSKFLIVEVYGSKRRTYSINEIEVYNVGGAAETFTTFTALFTRLEALGYPAFYQDGDAPQIPLSNLTDVEIDGLTDGQILKYNALSGKWENADESGGGGNLVYYFKEIDSQSFTNFTGLLIAKSFELPPDLLANGSIEIEVFARRNGSTINQGILFYLGNTAIDLTNQFAVNSSGTSSLVLNLTTRRVFIFENGSIIRNSNTIYGSDIDNFINYGGGNNYTVQNLVFDFSQNNFLNIVFQHNNLSQTSIYEGIVIKIYN